MNFKWINEHWAILSSAIAAIIFCVAAVADEYASYTSVKEAVIEQKAFNTKYERSMQQYSVEMAELNANQQRIDERTTLMLKILENMNKRLPQ